MRTRVAEPTFSVGSGDGATIRVRSGQTPELGLNLKKIELELVEAKYSRIGPKP